MSPSHYPHPYHDFQNTFSTLGAGIDVLRHQPFLTFQQDSKRRSNSAAVKTKAVSFGETTTHHVDNYQNLSPEEQANLWYSDAEIKRMIHEQYQEASLHEACAAPAEMPQPETPSRRRSATKRRPRQRMMSSGRGKLLF